MPARRRIRKGPTSRPRKVQVGSASVGIAVHLTRAEVQKLKERTASDLQPVPSYATWLVAEHLNGPVRRRPVGSVPGAGPGDRRTSLRITLVMSAETRDRLLTRAEAEMRSVSN
jgi:hypothetical protein